jgi:hypothetical protein
VRHLGFQIENLDIEHRLAWCEEGLRYASRDLLAAWKARAEPALRLRRCGLTSARSRNGACWDQARQARNRENDETRAPERLGERAACRSL